ncbi:MAG: hypothetical protein OSJ45_11070 [Lachnospiraceae bacterium]|nr:hypothetical protein [Lachnospiraceae bacterium]
MGIIEYDYDGDMSYYQNQLAMKGITKEMFDMDNYVGLTASELQGIVDSIRLVTARTDRHQEIK